MEIKISSGNIREVEADAFILYLYEGTDHLEGELAEIDTVLEGEISRLLDRGEIKGKPGQLTIIHSLGKLPSSRVVICGIGIENELNLNSIRKVVAEACRSLEQNNIETIATVLFGESRIPVGKSSQAMTIH